ncbi:vitamin B12 ABC transporter ATP-binding protein BtuD [Vibrio sp. LaRot3]|uniref:vitamin B12 ABC transporter ATP-binding protein BtuD n=1 Tax=Vibrio sp. LaRot3 TaxID=2998829 RepID=UPI0022CE22F7|nr:vitamin B12 ABC transporter ATP-binding protein BtuD [Vibrio sp. LaRot3]MDA0147644.1 vitamin B12 ABC transporter ATP-binding protein BtuD [Vibrio sp. LaRot3]
MIHVNSLSVGSRLLPLSFSLEQGEILHVIGPNGSGKSTLLIALSGLLSFEGKAKIGELDVESASLEALSNSRAFLSQSDRPAFNLEVSQYIALSVPVAADVDEVNRVVDELAGILNIQDKLHRSIHHLSGGEWQRVRLCAICLQIWPSLNPQAKLLVLDEPAAPLDIGQETLLYRLIERVAQLGITVVMSNHDLNRTLQFANKALLLSKGVLHSTGEVEQVLEPNQLSDVFATKVSKAQVGDKSVLIFE